jgi:hypothetical protein
MGNALQRCCQPEVSTDLEIYNSEREYSSSGIQKNVSVNEIERPKQHNTGRLDDSTNTNLIG